MTTYENKIKWGSGKRPDLGFDTSCLEWYLGMHNKTLIQFVKWVKSEPEDK